MRPSPTAATAAGGVTPPPVPGHRTTPWAAAVLVTGLALLLRLYQIGAEGLTPDEGISIDRVRAFHWDYVRPLYFVILWAWSWLGDSEAMLRLPSAMLGAATVPLVYLLGERLSSPRAGLIAALLVAVSPLHLNHSQEIRMYSQVTFFAAASFLCFHRLLEKSRARQFLAYGASTAAMLLTQPISLFALVAQNLYLVTGWRRHRRLATWWLAAQAGVLLLALPFVRTMAEQAPAFAQDWASTREKPSLQEVVRLVSDFSFWKRSLLFEAIGRPAYLTYYGLLLGTLALLAAAPLLTRRRAPQVTLVALWFAVPLASVLAISFAGVNIWQARYLLYILPAYALLIGFSVDRLARHSFGRLAAVFAAAIAVAGLGIDAGYYAVPVRADWRGAIAYIRAHRQPGDGFGVYADQAGPAFGYYYEREFGRAPARSDDRVRSAALHQPGPESPPDEAAAPGQALRGRGADWASLALEPRVFRALTPEELRRLLALLPPDRPRYWLVLTHHGHRGGASIKRYIEANYEVLARPRFQYIELLLFRPRSPNGSTTG